MAGPGDAPRVSVVMPAYNAEATIARAVRSVLDQGFGDLELIVVDDGSSDGTEAAVRAFGDDRVRWVAHPENRGEAEARNTGVAAARGGYVAYLDADDEWLPDKLGRQVALLDGVAGEVRACCTGVYRVVGGEPIVRVPRLTTPWRKGLLMGSNLSPGATLLVTRNAFDRVGGYDAALPRHTDWDWLLRYAERFPMYILPEPLARVHVGGRPRAAVLEHSARHFVEKHRAAYAAYGSVHRRRALAARWLEVAQHHFAERHYGAGTRYLLRALALYPFQRVGRYLLVVDAILGTSLGTAAFRVKSRWQEARRRAAAGRAEAPGP